MNIRRRQKFEHSQYAHKMRRFIKSLPSEQIISTGFSREKIDKICIQELKLALQKFAEKIQAQNPQNSKFLIEDINLLISKLDNPSNILENFSEFRLIRKRWNAIK